jgi:hypothetical protein
MSNPPKKGLAVTLQKIGKRFPRMVFFDLVDFAKRQRNEHFENLKGDRFSFVKTATSG